MSSKPLVSAVINFLNAEQFIREAIESVFAQTYDNWELLLVDDGSTDASTEIALRYLEQHPEKVRYLEHAGHQNRGASASRNLGSSYAKGEYIAFLDADDVWLPQKLEQQVTILESHPDAAMVYGAFMYWCSWTGSPDDMHRDFMQDLGVEPNTLIRPPKLLPLFLRDEGTTPVPSGIMVRRNTDAAIGGFEESFRSIYDDQVYCAKLGLQAPVFASDKCWHWYRQHVDQRCRVTAQTGQYHSARLDFLEWLEGYLSGQGVTDREVWTVLRQELWPYRHSNLHRWQEQMKVLVKWIARRTVPLPVRRWLRPLWHGRRYRPPVGYVLFGHLRRLQPISRVFGSDRGRCIDRYYIENFLGQHRDDIQGRVLEIGDGTYTRRFGGERVTQSDVLHVQQANPSSAIIAHLSCAERIRSDTFDCIILPQTLQHILDVQTEVRGLYRTLKPGGVLLATCPGIGQTSRWGDYWRFTTLSARRLFEAVFPAGGIEVAGHGKLLAATASLHGLAAEELRPEELDYRDLDYEVLITVRAVKPEATS